MDFAFVFYTFYHGMEGIMPPPSDHLTYIDETFDFQTKINNIKFILPTILFHGIIFYLLLFFIDSCKNDKYKNKDNKLEKT